MRFLNRIATTNNKGMIAITTSANCELISIMKYRDVPIFARPHITSSKPQLTNQPMRSVSEVSRDMTQPTGVRS